MRTIVWVDRMVCDPGEFLRGIPMLAIKFGTAPPVHG